MNRSMPCRLALLLAVLLSCVPLLSCGGGAASATPRGQLLVWHSFAEEDLPAVKDVVARFEAAYPEVNVVCTARPESKLVSEYVTRAEKGLGPDVLIALSRWAPQLADAGLIRDLSLIEDLDTTTYQPHALGTLQYADGLYGLPLSMRTSAMYYNATLVDEPAATLEALLTQTAEGKTIFVPTSFYRAFWGIPAFGGELYDETGRLVLHQGGFSNWLGWLKLALNSSGIIMGADPEIGLSLFSAGELAYYVGTWSEMRGLKQALGDDVLGVAPLPAGPLDAAGPLLETDAMMINAASSDEQVELALTFAAFMSNVEQQTKLVRTLDRIPANGRVRVDARVSPRVAAFVAQAKTAVPMPGTRLILDVIASGDEAYTQALEGVSGVSQAAFSVTDKLNARYGYTTEALQATCNQEGTITVWHSFDDSMTATLRAGVYRYVRNCPGVYVQLRYYAPDEIGAAYETALQARRAPDVLVTSQDLVLALAQNGEIRDLTADIAADTLQRFLPAALGTVSVGKSLYALPYALDTSVLYYKADVVSSVPRDIDDLLSQAGRDSLVVLPSSFDGLAWSAAAYGVLTTDADGVPALAAEQLPVWADWLRQTAGLDGVLFNSDSQMARSLFETENCLYLVGPSRWLPEFRRELGEERVGVATLPSGPAGDATGWLSASGICLKPGMSEVRADLCLGLARFLTSEDGQVVLATMAMVVPSNVNVDLQPYPALVGVEEQVRGAIARPTSGTFGLTGAAADALVVNALAGIMDTEDLVQLFLRESSAAAATGDE